MLCASAQVAFAAAHVPLRVLLDSQLLAWATLVAAAADSNGAAQSGTAEANGHFRAAASTGQHAGTDPKPPDLSTAAVEPNVPEPRPPRRPAMSSLDTGQLDLSAFGMAAPAPEEVPIASSQSQLDSGLLDMSAFGMASMMEPEPPRPSRSQLDTGQLDLSAFGMGFASSEPPSRQAASQVESGQLDMSAFGLPSTDDLPTAQPAHSQVENGQLDLSAFDMGYPIRDPPPQPAASQIESGQLDMSAFGLPSLADNQAQQQSLTALESGQLDLSTFGIGLPAPESIDYGAQHSTTSHIPAQPSPQAKSVLPTSTAGLAVVAERPLTAEELRQLRSALGVAPDDSADASASLHGRRTVKPLAVPGAQHTAAAFLAAASGVDADEDEDDYASGGVAHNSGGAEPASAPGLSAADTAEALAVAQLLLPEGASDGCASLDCVVMVGHGCRPRGGHVPTCRRLAVHRAPLV